MNPITDAELAQFQRFIFDEAGITLSAAKKALVMGRLGKRLSHHNLDSFGDYFKLLASGKHPDEVQMAVDLLTTNETYFFREPAHYDLLEQELARTRPRKMSVWSAASSFGDEAYSTAMLLSDQQQLGRIGSDWSILGTDISDRVLRSAMEAVYPEDRLRNVSPERLKRYCLRGEGPYEGLISVHPRVREHVRFGQLNLCKPIEDIGPFDVIFLRNVLIYFDAQTKREVVDRVLTQLKPGGLFFIGTAEGRVPCKTPLQSLAPGAFRKAVA
jgi:chemotaxis protein methyltransferase CheR